jgi:CheY-like chemotaxis protein
MEDVSDSIEKLQGLRNLGVNIAIDDFGTGYSSLYYLARLPVQFLKIDGSFIYTMTDSGHSKMIVSTIISLAHALGMRVIAEGVETREQLQLLETMHCDEMQGYLFSRPLPADDCEQLLRERKRLILPAAEEGDRKTLLIVDDETGIRDALRRVLRRDGYEIFSVGSAREGFDILASHEVQVILSDQRMPEMNGTEFLARVRGLYPDTIRIVLSGYSDLESVVDAVNRGAIYRFLTKPWDDDQLREHVREAFRHQEAARHRG